jgi:hypothetical protein
MEDVTFRGAVHRGKSKWSYSFASWPFAVLMVSPVLLRLASSWPPRFRYEFPKESIQKLILRQRNIFPGIPIASLQIMHNLPELPSFLVFGTFDPEKLTSVWKLARFELSPV